MSRRSVFVALLACSCPAPPPPDTPAAREAAAVCAAEAPPALVFRRLPGWRFKAALEAAAKQAVSPDMSSAITAAGLDYAERAAAIRAAAEGAGVRSCALADSLTAQATATPGPLDRSDGVKMLEAAASLSPEPVLPLMAEGCAEIAPCGRECVPGLSGLAALAPEQRAPALAAGCAEFRPQASGGEAAVDAFLRARIGRFFDACAPEFDADTAARVSALRQQLAL